MFACLVFFPISDVLAEQKVILNIAAYHKGYGWTDDCIKGINQELNSQYKVIHYYMDTKRLPKSAFGNAMEKAWKKFMQINPDIVMLGDDNALMLLGPRFSKQKTTVVFYGINGNPRSYFSKAMPFNIKGVLERVPIIPLVRDVVRMNRLHPNKQVTILSDGGTSSAAQLKTRFHGVREKQIGQFKVLFLDFSEWKDWKNYIRNAKKTNAALISTNYHAIHDNGKSIDYMKVLSWTSKNSKLPVFIVQKDVGPGMATGALLIDGIIHGKLAADMVNKTIHKQRVPQFVEDVEGKYIFSRNQLKKFNLNLPESIKKQSKMVN